MPLNLPFIPTVRDTSNLENSISGIWKNLKSIWGHLNVELKHHDLTIENITLPATAQFQELTDIDSGITGSSSSSIDRGYRDGDKIRLKTANVKIRLSAHASATKSIKCHFLLVKHYDNFLGGSVSFNDIYDPYTSTYVASRQRNHDGIKTYKILARKTVNVEANTNDDNVRQLTLFHKFTKRVGSFVEWEGTQGTDPSNGKLYLAYYCEENNNQPLMYASSRVTYIDN